MRELSNFSMQIAFDLLMASQDLFAIYDNEDRLLMANSSYKQAFHTSKSLNPDWHDMMLANFNHNRGPVIETDDIFSWLQHAESKRGSCSYRAFELELHDGRWIFLTETTMHDGNMLMYGTDFSAVHSDTRALREERNDARRRAQTDDLTGLPNRPFTFEQIKKWLEPKEPRLQQYTHSLALIDIDKFKKINDLHGHHIGDKVLFDFSKKMINLTRLNDIFGRIGGEEFLLFLPGCPLEIALPRLENIQRKINNTKTITDNLEIGYSFSAGLVEATPGEDLDSLLLRADGSLYKAKKFGRNKIEVDDSKS